MEEGVGDEKDDNTEILDEKKKAKDPDVTPPVDMEEGVDDDKMTVLKYLMREKRQNAQMSLLLMIWRKV